MVFFFPITQDLGYQGEVGYQTFLYSSEPEIRRLLLFLVEKLPRDASEDADQPVGTVESGQKQIWASEMWSFKLW